MTTLRHDGGDRYAVYDVKDDDLRHLCDTSREGVILSIETLLDEDEVRRGARVGVLDQLNRRWVVNPWA